MRLRDAWPIAMLAVAVASGCGGNKGYVTTSLANQQRVQSPLDRIGDKRRPKEGEAGIQRDLAEMPRLLEAGEFEAVRRQAAAVLERHPDSIDAHTYLAVAMEGAGDSAGAGAHYRRAAELAPGNGGVLGNYGIWLCGQDRAVESLSWFDRALEVPGYADSPMILANSGACAGRAGDPVRADRELRRAIAIDPDNTVALAALAALAFASGHAFEARAFSERRLAAAPADPKALLLASQIEQELGDSVAAARYVARLEAEFPDAAEARNSTMGRGGRQ